MTIGTRTKDKVEVVSGLKVGETVVIEGNFALADGTKVEVAVPEKEEEAKPKGEEKEP
ncbi:MAG TPA: hypothetical protein VIJ87_08700 [Pyrinomonadaceae bacterium]